MQKDQLWAIVLAHVDIPLVKELGEILEEESYEDLIW